MALFSRRNSDDTCWKNYSKIQQGLQQIPIFHIDSHVKQKLGIVSKILISVTREIFNFEPILNHPVMKKLSPYDKTTYVLFWLICNYTVWVRTIHFLLVESRLSVFLMYCKKIYIEVCFRYDFLFEIRVEKKRALFESR